MCDLTINYLKFCLNSTDHYIEARVHECGHQLMVLSFSFIRIGGKPIKSCVNPIYNYLLNKQTGFITTSNIDDLLRSEKHYILIRLYASGGVLFMTLICLILNCFVGYNYYLDSAIYGCICSIFYLELLSVFNGRDTNDLSMFLHPEKF